MGGGPWLATRATAETRSLHKPSMIGVPIIPYVLGSTLVFVRRRDRTEIVTAPPWRASLDQRNASDNSYLDGRLFALVSVLRQRYAFNRIPYQTLPVRLCSCVRSSSMSLSLKPA